MFRRNPQTLNCRRLSLEQLETRRLLASDLEITGVRLVDVLGNPISSVVEGQQAFVRAEWKATGIPEGTQYKVNFELNGFPISVNIISDSSEANVPLETFRYVGYGAPGMQHVAVTLDEANQVGEDDETNNQMVLSFTPEKPSLNPRFQIPLVGEAYRDWYPVHYHDVDPTINSNGGQQDARGFQTLLDQQTTWNFLFPSYEHVDAGRLVIAAAAGTVVEVNDGEYDRFYGLQDTSQPTNFVTIDHGNGWTTRYTALLKDSVAVRVGQAIQAGDTLALAGGSGDSVGPNLQFSILKDNAPVEPLYAPSSYFDDPLPYIGDYPRQAVGFGISAVDPTADRLEQVNEMPEIRSDDANPVYFWVLSSDYQREDRLEISWTRPNGEEHASHRLSKQIGRFNLFTHSVDASDYLGIWTVRVRHNGAEIALKQFRIVGNNEGVPEIDVRLGVPIGVTNLPNFPVPHSGWTVGGEQSVAMDFTTGPEGPTELSEIIIGMKNSRHANQALELAIVANSHDLPGEFIAKLEGPNPVGPTYETYAYTPVTPVTLQPSTTYWITASSTASSGSYAWPRTDDTSDKGRSDWKIGGHPAFIVFSLGPNWFRGDIQSPTMFQVNVVTQQTAYLIANRSTPIDFGDLAQGGTGAHGVERTFRLNNIGSTTLEISEVDLPDGFVLAGSMPQSIGAGATGLLPVRMTGAVPGKKRAEIRFQTNDPDEGDFRFEVEGNVVPADDPNAPTVEHPTSALVFDGGTAVKPIFPSLVVLDADDSDFERATIVVKIAAAEQSGDRLVVRPDGQLVQNVGNRIFYLGNEVGFLLQDGSNGCVEIKFTGRTTSLAIQAIVRTIHFWQMDLLPSARRRMVSLQFQDPKQNFSNVLHRGVFHSLRPLQHPPLVDPIRDKNMLEDGAPPEFPLVVSDLETATLALAVTGNSSNQQLLSDDDIHLSVVNETWMVRLVPRANQWGSTTVSLVVQNDLGMKTEVHFALDVFPQNDAPTITSLEDHVIEKNRSLGPLAFGIQDLETTASQLVLEVSSSNTDLVDSADIEIEGNDGMLNLFAHPKPNQIGATEITLSVRDEDGATASETFRLDVVHDVTPPHVTTIGDQRTLEDTLLQLPITIDDNETPTDQLSIETQSSNSLLLPSSNVVITGTGTSRTLTFQPTANMHGHTVVALSVTDLHDNITTQSFSVTVEPVNDLPEFLLPVLVVPEDSEPLIAEITGINPGGMETQPLMVEVGIPDDQLLSAFDLDFVDPSDTATLRFQPLPDRFGTVHIPVTFSDGGLDKTLATVQDNGKRTQTLTLQITPVNDPPSMDTPFPVVVTEDAFEQVTILRNIASGIGESQPVDIIVTHSDDLISSVQVHHDPGNSTASLTWTPAPNRFGTTEIHLTVEDGGVDHDLLTKHDNASVTETLSVTIQPKNDPPMFSLPIGLSADEDTANVEIPVTDVVGGPFGETDTVRFIVQAFDPSQLSELSIQHVPGSSTASITLKPRPDVFGDVQIVVLASDGGEDGDFETLGDNAQTQQTLTFTLNPVNDPPTALQLPTTSIPEDGSQANIGTVRVLDPDPDDSFTFKVSDPRFDVNGTDLVLVDPTGLNFESEPLIAFTVTASDSHGESVVATISLTVTDVNEPPTAITVEQTKLYAEIFDQSFGQLVAADPDFGQSHSFESLDDRFEVASGILRQKIGTRIPRGTAGFLHVRLRVTDSGNPPAMADMTVALEVIPVLSPWKNPVFGFDVNADGFASPIDALLVINFLNKSAGPLNAQQWPPLASGPYWDVSGDRSASPIDALLVINHLNSSSGEGEFGVPTLPCAANWTLVFGAQNNLWRQKEDVSEPISYHPPASAIKFTEFYRNRRAKHESALLALDLAIEQLLEERDATNRFQNLQYCQLLERA